jgi:hypothetical protein
MTSDFAAIAIALYCAHHVADYWVQTDWQAAHKGLPTGIGRVACTSHVLTYVMTQFAFLALLWMVTDIRVSTFGLVSALTVSGVTHWIADRRAPLMRIFIFLTGNTSFAKLGVPRKGMILVSYDGSLTHECVPIDNPSLGTGPAVLDQSWHIFWGVFVAALIAVGV